MVHCPLCHIHLVPRVNPNSVQGGTTPQNSQCHQGAYPPGHIGGLLVQLTQPVVMLCAEVLGIQSPSLNQSPQL